ncbi:MAG: DNA-directed RNA polymerase subunit omega [bacterium]|nr:DNA-directed RNA polymerase subunit omega [bacterium]
MVAAAKRARQIMMGYARLVECDSDKPVTVALEELRSGKIRLEGSRPGPQA